MRVDELDSPDEYTLDASRRRFHRQRQNGIDRFAAGNIQEPRALFEPRVAPRLDHRSRFGRVEAMRYEQCFDVIARSRAVVANRNSRKSQRAPARHQMDGFGRDRAAAILKDQHVADVIAIRRGDGNRPIVHQSRENGRLERADASIEQKLLALCGRLQQRGAGSARGVVMAGCALDGQRRVVSGQDAHVLPRNRAGEVPAVQTGAGWRRRRDGCVREPFRHHSLAKLDAHGRADGS